MVLLRSLDRNTIVFNRRKAGSILAWRGRRSRSASVGDIPFCSNATVQTCLPIKVLFGMALRQTAGFVESLLGLIGLHWDVPNFSTPSRRQKALAVTIPHRDAQGAAASLDPRSRFEDKPLPGSGQHGDHGRG